MTEPNGAETRVALKFALIGVKAGRTERIEGSGAFPGIDSLKDTLALVMSRDSRLMEAVIMDPSGKILWHCTPGSFRALLEKAGFTPDSIVRPR